MFSLLLFERIFFSRFIFDGSSTLSDIISLEIWWSSKEAEKYGFFLFYSEYTQILWKVIILDRLFLDEDYF